MKQRGKNKSYINKEWRRKKRKGKVIGERNIWTERMKAKKKKNQKSNIKKTRIIHLIINNNNNDK